MEEYNVYIDESGDEGLKRGSKFFIITAIVVNTKNDLKLANKMRNIKNDLEIYKNQLHWNKIKGFPNKKYIIDEIAEEDFNIIHLIVDTSSIVYLNSNEIYYKFFNYLLERIFLCIDGGKIKNLNISSRNGLSYNALILNIQNEYNIISLERIKRIKIIANGALQLLQLADICSSSFHQSLKYETKQNKYYTLKLNKKFFRKYNRLVGYGIKLVPNSGNFDEYYRLNLK